MWYPPEGLGFAGRRLEEIAKRLSFRDFEFTARIRYGDMGEGGLFLQCDWGNAHARASIPPMFFTEKGFRRAIVRDLLISTVLEAAGKGWPHGVDK